MDKIAQIKAEVAEKEKQYILPENVEVESINKEKEMIGCTLLVEIMEENGASEEELKTVLTYCTIVADADKLRLDWRKAYEDLGIDNFCEKYIKIDEEKENEK